MWTIAKSLIHGAATQKSPSYATVTRAVITAIKKPSFEGFNFVTLLYVAQYGLCTIENGDVGVALIWNDGIRRLFHAHAYAASREGNGPNTSRLSQAKT